MGRRLKHALPIERTSKTTGKKEMRLFWMSDHQAKVYRQSVDHLMKVSFIDENQADALVREVLLKMILGRVPSESHPAMMHDLRRSFPVLGDLDFDAMPVAGCPDGHIPGMIIVFSNKEGRLMLRVLWFSFEQAAAYNSAIEVVSQHNELDRDNAWLFVNNTVNALIMGMGRGVDNEIIQDLADVFPELSQSQVKRLPHASEIEMRDLSYRSMGIQTEYGATDPT